MISLLNLIKNQACIKNTSLDEIDRLRCKLALNAYEFPVESMVIHPNGTVLHRINANVLLEISNKYHERKSFMQSTFLDVDNSIVEDPISNEYEKFLIDGLATQN